MATGTEQPDDRANDTPTETPERRAGAVSQFRPAPWLAGPARQTVFGTLLPVRYPGAILAPRMQEILVPNGSGEEKLTVFVTPAPRRPRRPTGRLILLHGMGGSADSRYMLRTTEEGHRRGWEVARMNFRGARDGHPGGPTFHNAQRTEDVAACVEQVHWSLEARRTPLAIVGFSLGGAVLLKYLGQVGSLTPVGGAVAVAAPIDLAACLGALERPRNWLYHRYFVRRMRAQIGPKVRAHPGTLPALTRGMSSVRQLDAVYTAPDAGYPSAESYYEVASSKPLLRRITVPSLLLSSRDDPFIPADLFDDVRGGPIDMVMTSAGGHIGFLEAKGFWISFWAARAILGWLESALSR